MKKVYRQALKRILGKSYVWLILFFFYVPILMVVIYSFNNTNSPNSAIWHGFSLRWYETLFNNPQVGLAVRNSVLIALITVALSIVLGTPAAISMWERNLRINHILENLSYVVFCAETSVRTLFSCNCTFNILYSVYNNNGAGKTDKS